MIHGLPAVAISLVDLATQDTHQPRASLTLIFLNLFTFVILLKVVVEVASFDAFISLVGERFLDVG